MTRYSIQLLTRMVRYADALGSMTFEADADPAKPGVYLLWPEPVRPTGLYRWIRPKGRVEIVCHRIVEHFEIRGEVVRLTS